MKGITILFQQDNPNGLKIVEMDGWSGKCFIAPRANLKDLKKIPEASQPGIYFLFGEGEDPARPEVYIGQGAFFIDRLLVHDKDAKKNKWSTAVAFTGGLDVGDVTFLEHVAVKMAKSANRYKIENGNAPKEKILNDYRRNSAEAYFENIRFILSAFGFSLFDEKPSERSVEEMYYWKTDKADAKGTLLENSKFIVFESSVARIKESPSFIGSSGSNLRARLLKEGILKHINDDSYVFTKDHIFTSPSAAGDTVAGRSTNGWTVWGNKNKKTLDEVKRK